MIFLFTDFSLQDPYVGQMKAAIFQRAPQAVVVDLLHNVPSFNPRAGAYLLAALAETLPPACVILAVVDPGVGGSREMMVMAAGGRWYIGPDNGLLSVVAARCAESRYWRIHWRPHSVSATFHGRDVFAPVAAEIACGQFPEDKLVPADCLAVKLEGGDIDEIIYLDHYGNAVTGRRAATLARGSTLMINGLAVPFAPYFSAFPTGTLLWYQNSLGLVELAVNCGSAADTGLLVGQRIDIRPPTFPVDPHFAA